MARLDGAIDLAHLSPSRTADSGRALAYPKSGDRWFTKGNTSAELPIGCDAWSCTSSTRPASPFAGMMIYETDTKNSLLYDSVVGSWKYVGNRCLCTSSTRPTGLLVTEGLEIYESDTDKTYININGSWVQNVLSTGPSELGYAQITANLAAVTTTALTDQTGLSITVTVGSRPIMVEAWAVTQHTAGSGNDFRFFTIREGTTALAWDPGPDALAANPSTQQAKTPRLTPSAGSHTYKVSIAPGTGARGMQILAGVGGFGNQFPAWIRAYEL